jgi:hypothetical protein
VKPPLHWILGFALACGVAAAELGEVAGVVQDTSGAALVGAAITAMDEATGVRRATRTDNEGVYDIPGLPPGLYKLTVRKPGFQTIVQLNVKVDPGADLRLDFAMRVGSVKEVITVEGSSPAMNTADASVGTLIGRKAIESLPTNGRGVFSLVELIPGVVATPASSGEAGQFSTNGLRSNTNYFTVDGVSANTGVSGAGIPAQFAGAALPSMTAFGSTENLASVETLDEVRVLTSSFAPEYGRLPGAQVALTTRSGSDEYHGTVYMALRNEVLNANDWFANAYGVNRPALRMEQWGATFSGPMLRQRTYFFGSYEGLRLREPHDWLLATVPRDARESAPPSVRPLLNAFPIAVVGASGVGLALVSRRSRLDSTSLRIDHSLTERVSIFGRYHRAPSATESGFPQVEALRLRSSGLTVGLTAMPTAAVTSDSRVSVWSAAADSSWSNDRSTGATPIDLGDFLDAPPTAGPAFYGAAIGGIGALLSGSSGRNRQREWNVVETFSVNRRSHSWRVGADYERLLPARETASQAVTGTWPSLADTLAARPPTIRTTRAEQASGLIETLSLFIQDTYRPWQRLSVTYGLRWELTPPPAVLEPAAAYTTASPANGTAFPSPVALPLADTAQALWNSSYAQLAPRLGAALRIDNSSVVRAGWGLFYDVGFGVALDPINGFPFNRWQFSPTGAAGPVSGTPAFGPRVETGLKLPYVTEWNVAYERTLTVRNIVSLSYVGSSGRRLLRREGVAAPGSQLAEYQAATNHGWSAYQGFEAQYRRRMGAQLQGTASYAWAHSMDNGSADSGVYVADTQLARGDRGSSAFDVRHNLTAGLTFTPQHSGPLLKDWELSGMLRARTGFPIDVVVTENLLGTGFDDIGRPNLVPGVPIWIQTHTIGGRRLNPDAFAVAPGVQGSLGRNAIAGFGMAQLDLALARVLPLSPAANVQLRFEAFNVFNHVNPANPVRFLDSPILGRPPSMLNLMLGTGTARSGVAPAFQIGGPRSLQATIRFQF